MWKKDVECFLINKFTKEKKKNNPEKVNSAEITPSHRLFAIVHKEILPRKGRKSKSCFRDLRIMNVLDMSEKVYLIALMIKHTRSVTSSKTEPYSLAYDFLLFVVFVKFNVPLEKGIVATRFDMLHSLP